MVRTGFQEMVSKLLHFSAVGWFLGEKLTEVEVSSQAAGCLVGSPAKGGRMWREARIEEGRGKDWN